MVLIAPSILSADFTNLGKEISKLEQAKADLIHIDIMDGHFVPNFTIGNFVVRQLRSLTKLPFDVHLMVENPEKMVPWFIEAGADILTIHFESCKDLPEVLKKIKSLGIKAGVSIKPSTPAKALKEYLDFLDNILVMTVEPGFGGQAFLDSQLSKVAELKQMIGSKKISIEVDGGINDETGKKCVKAGADILVSGKFVFADGDYAKNIARLR